MFLVKSIIVNGFMFVLLCSAAFAQGPLPDWRDDFETETPDWKVLHTERQACVVAQQRTHEIAHGGKKSEKLHLRLPAESSLVIGHSLGFPLSMPAFSPSVYVKATQPGITIAIQVVLPNSLDPQTNRPISFLVHGTKYSGSGEWEKLGFWDGNEKIGLAAKIERTGRLLGVETKRNFDLRGVYVRQIILFAEGDSAQHQEKTVWIDQLEVFGHLAADTETLQRTEGNTPFRFDPINYNGFLLQVSNRCYFPLPLRSENTVIDPTLAMTGTKPLHANPGPGASVAGVRELYSSDNQVVRYTLTQGNAPTPATARFRLSERTLLVNDVPIGVRAIEYRGEPLAYLRKLEFNAVWVNERPSPELLKEAQNAGVWLICPPPGSAELKGAQSFNATATPRGVDRTMSHFPLLDSIYDNVLAWNLGDECTGYDYPEFAKRAGDLQNADRARRRPILCTASSGMLDYSRSCNILMMRRDPILTSLDLSEVPTWQRNYQQLARPDTPFWGTIQTQPSPKIANQWTLFGANPQEICAVSYEQLQIQVYQALAAECHGLLFTSNTPLTNNDPETEYRRTALELINWNLQLIEEWFAAGRVDTAYIKSNKPSMGTTVLKAGRTRLLIPIWTEPKSQYGVGPAVVGDVDYVIAGVPETYSAYHLVPGRLYPLAAPRVAGGMKIHLDEANLNSLIIFSGGDSIYANVDTRAREIGKRAAYLACHLADLHLASTENVLSTLKQAKEMKAIPNHDKDKLPLIDVTEQESMLKTTRETINLAKQFIVQNPPGYASSYLLAEQATRGLRVTAREMLREATRHDSNPCMTPVSVSFSTLPYYIAMFNRVSGGGLGENRLPTGDMENLTAWLQAGWGSRLHKVDGVGERDVKIAPAAKRSQGSGLQLSTKPVPGEETPLQLETSPLWVYTPPIPMRMGELICISGWVKVPRAITATVDGLMIYDSLGGEELALRFKKASNWQQFVIYRYAPTDGNFFLFFSLFGLGEVHLDDIHVAAVQLPIPPPVPPSPVQQPQTPPTLLQLMNPLQYLPLQNRNQQ